MKRLVALLTSFGFFILPLFGYPWEEKVERPQNMHNGRHIRFAQEISLPPCGIRSDCLKLKLMLREIDHKHLGHPQSGHHRHHGGYRYRHRHGRGVKWEELPLDSDAGDRAYDNFSSAHFTHGAESLRTKVDVNPEKEEHERQRKPEVSAFRKIGAASPKMRQLFSEDEKKISGPSLVFRTKDNHREKRTIDASYYGGGMSGGPDAFYDYDYDYDFLADPGDKQSLEEYYEEELAKEERNIGGVGYDEARLQTLRQNDVREEKDYGRESSAGSNKSKDSKKPQTEGSKQSKTAEKDKKEHSNSSKEKDAKASKGSSDKAKSSKKSKTSAEDNEESTKSKKGKAKKKGSKSKSSKKGKKAGKSSASGKEDSEDDSAAVREAKKLREWSRQNAGQIEHLLSKLNTLIGDIEESESHGGVGVVTAAKKILKDQGNATGSCSPLKHSVVASGFKSYVNYLSSRVPSSLPYVIEGEETFLLHHLDKSKKDNNVQLSVELRSKSCHCLKGLDIKSIQIGGKRHAMMTKFTLEYYDGGWNYIHNQDGKMKLFSVAGQLAHDSMVPFHRRIYTTALRVFPQDWMRLPWVRVQPVECG